MNVMNQIYCSNCGKLIPESSNFCKFCGASQHGPQARTYRAKNPALGHTAVWAAEQQATAKKPAPAAKKTQNHREGKYIENRLLCPRVRISFVIGYLTKTSILPLLLIVGAILNPLVFGGALIIYGLALYIAADQAYKNFYYSIDKMGFRKEYGIIHKKSVSVPYDKIQNVNITRSLTDRMLDLSRINIETAGNVAIDDEYIIGGSKSSAEAHLPGVTLSQAKKIHDLVISNIDD